MPNTPNKSNDINRPASKPRPEPAVLKLIRFAFQVGGRIAPPIAGRIAYKLWLTPTRHKTPASEKEALDSADIQYIQINDNKITTFSWGTSGPIVLLVHGWSGRGTQMGAFIRPLLNAGYRVLSFDAPAHGKSTGKQTNIYQVADTIIAMQHHFGTIDSVISHSFGGPCAAIAIQRGLKIKRLISICPPANTLGLIEKFISILRIPTKAGDHLTQRFENNFGKEVWHDVSMVNTVKQLKIPGLLIHDSHDDDIPWQEGHAVSEAWDNAEFIKTTGLGHRRILRDAAVIEAVVSFISDSNKDE